MQRPDVEARITAELDAAGLLATPQRPNPRPMELADLNELPYFINVCKVGQAPPCYQPGGLHLLSLT